MSRFAKGIRPGIRVTQGQVIGYVGATGLASGPHVHYEFLKDGKQVNALKVDLGDGAPLPKARQREFGALRSTWEQQLSLPPRPEPEPTPAPVKKPAAKPRAAATRSR
jgi:murein DD-endopeptidase MepM/ murein hydrolase activator NlpD